MDKEKIVDQFLNEICSLFPEVTERMAAHDTVMTTSKMEEFSKLQMEGADVYVNVIDNIGNTDSNGEITHSFSIIGVYSIYAMVVVMTNACIVVMHLL